jgi:hypothetical protein
MCFPLLLALLLQSLGCCRVLQLFGVLLLLMMLLLGGAYGC